MVGGHSNHHSCIFQDLFLALDPAHVLPTLEPFTWLHKECEEYQLAHPEDAIVPGDVVAEAFALLEFFSLFSGLFTPRPDLKQSLSMQETEALAWDSLEFQVTSSACFSMKTIRLLSRLHGFTRIC